MKSTFLPAALTVCLVAFAAAARAAPAWQDFQVLRAQARTWLEHQASKAYPDAQVEVQVGAVDDRLRLADCAQPGFFLSTNAQLWGRGSLGVRCDGPAQWTLFLGYQNRVRGPALVTTRPLPARHAPQPGDLVLKQVEYAQSPDSYPRELTADVRLNRALAAGQAVQIGWLMLPQVIQAGRKVVVTVKGTSFSIAQEGIALNNAAPGDATRVKTSSGRIVQGIATREGRVEIRP